MNIKFPFTVDYWRTEAMQIYVIVTIIMKDDAQ